MTASGSANLLGIAENERSPPVILHVDMDCFYAACERLRRPELDGEPVVIGMGYDQDDPHGAVATASYEAREYGLESAMAISEALERLPRMVDADADDDTAPNPDEAGYYLPVDMSYYKSVSSETRGILAEYADTLEPVSIDEAYLDVSDRVSWSEVEEFANDLKQEIASTVGVTASIGVAPTKSAAKVASDHDKPDGLVVVPPGTVQDFFAPLDIEAVHGIGPVTASELRDMGIKTAGDLASTPPETLESRFGSRGRGFYQRARGNDPRTVSPPEDPKSLSRETSFSDPVSDLEEKRETVRALASAVSDRAKSKNALYQTISIKVVTPPFDVHTRAQSLSGPVDDPELVESIAIELMEEFTEVRVRKLGVRVANLSFSDRQQETLSRWETEGGNESDGDDGAEVAGNESTQSSVKGNRRKVGQLRLDDIECQLNE